MGLAGLSVAYLGDDAMKRAPIILASVLLAALLLLVGYFGGRRHPPASSAQTGSAMPAAHGGDKKILYWYDTTVPQQHFDKPGTQPMGIQMFPTYDDEELAKNVVSMDQAPESGKE